jgi:hypothetical protein
VVIIRFIKYIRPLNPMSLTTRLREAHHAGLGGYQEYLETKTRHTFEDVARELVSEYVPEKRTSLLGLPYETFIGGPAAYVKAFYSALSDNPDTDTAPR